MTTATPSSSTTRPPEITSPGSGSCGERSAISPSAGCSLAKPSRFTRWASMNRTRPTGRSAAFIEASSPGPVCAVIGTSRQIAVWDRSSISRPRARAGRATPPCPGVRTTILVRSARNRSWENSISSAHASVVVRLIDSSGAPGATSRTIASSGDAATTSMRSTASLGRVPKCSSSRSYTDPPSGSSSRPGKRSAGSMACSTEIGLPSASRIRTRSITRSPGRSRSAWAADSLAPDIRALSTRVPATTPWLRSQAGTPTTRDRSRSIFPLLTNVPPPRPGTRRTMPLSSSTARAWRSVVLLTPSSVASARSARSRWPGRRSPVAIWSARTRRTSSEARALLIGAPPARYSLARLRHGTHWRASGTVLIGAPPARRSLPLQGGERLGQDLAAVNDDGLPGDVPGLVAGQEQGRVPDVVHRAKPPQRHRSGHLGHVVIAEIGKALGDDVARHHGVDRDAAGRELDRRGAHEAELAGLAGPVVTPAGEPGDRPGDRRGEDDPAVARGREGGQARLHRQDAALQVGADDLVDVGLGHVGQPGFGEDPGVGAQHVDAAHAVGRRLRHPVAVIPPGHVGEQIGYLGAARGQLGPARLRGLLVAPGDQDPGAAPSEHRGDSLADAAGRTGDHHGPALDRCEHARYPFTLPGGRQPARLRYVSARSQLSRV